MTMLSKFGGMSLDKIGQLFDKNHTTCIYAKKKVNQLCKAYPEIRDQVIEIENRLE